MLRKLGLLFAALAIFSIAGGHWAVLQSVAWAEMLHNYSHRSGSLAVAIAQTFDGDHPCELCQQIQVAKAKERKQTSTTPTTKDDAKVKALLAEPMFQPCVHAVAEISFPAAVSVSGSSRMEQPPTPPPRSLNLAA